MHLNSKISVFFLFQLAFTWRKVTDERAGEDTGGFVGFFLFCFFGLVWLFVFLCFVFFFSLSGHSKAQHS